jgi:hypothetical protein
MRFNTRVALCLLLSDRKNRDRWVNGRFWRILLQKSVEGFREQ